MAPIDLALEELRSLKQEENINITKIAEKYGINRSTLSRRFNGVTRSKEAGYNNQQFLNNEQSNTLIKWVNQLTERGLPPTR
jgi:DNA invertase Pin-like site-specific DNA recombinase